MNSVFVSSERVLNISSERSIVEASEKMRGNKIGCLIVTGENDKMVGIVTEKDIVARAVALGVDVNEAAVSGIMTEDVVFCSDKVPFSKLQDVMIKNRVRHLPIVCDGRVQRMYSIRDVVDRNLVEIRMAAEQAAMLSVYLKSIDFDEIVEMSGVEVPKFCQSERCSLSIFEEHSDGLKPYLIDKNDCRSLDEQIELVNEFQKASNRHKKYIRCSRKNCEGEGCEGFVVPLEIASCGQGDSEARTLRGYVCVCGFKESSCLEGGQLEYRLKLLADILNSHLTNARLYQLANDSSFIDPLTKVGSRKYLESHLNSECSRALRYNTKLSIAIIDMDNFKKINDKFGHAVGDKALCKLASCMKKEKRNSDFIARFGGDEFVVVMPETSKQNAMILLERIRLSIQRVEMPDDFKLSISVGVATREVDRAESPEDILRRSDVALYEAKSSGRNCVLNWQAAVKRVKSNNEGQGNRIKKLEKVVCGIYVQSKEGFVQNALEIIKKFNPGDLYMKSHCEKVSRYCVGIAKYMGIEGDKIEILRNAALIHDIGKLGLPEEVLTKKGSLGIDEMKIVKLHPLIGFRVLSKICFLEEEANIIRWHCEKLDGSGYPNGLSGSSIPFGSRVMAVADSFDALSSDRVWRKAKSIFESLAIISEENRGQFDPEVVAALKGCIELVGKECGSGDEVCVEDLHNSPVFEQPGIVCCV
jgi:diguanylate cyclase (GGDEF)-like protein